jgi:hypothetical protein
MSVQEISLPAASGNSFINNRVLGTIGMIFAPALYFASVFYSHNYDAPNPNQLYASLLGVLYLSGAIASAIGMRKLRVHGKGKGGAILFAVQIIGLFLAMMFDVFEFAAPHLRESAIFFIADMAYPFSHVLMIVVGIAVWKTGIWHGWRRISPFLIGFALPLFFAASAVFGRENSGWVFIGGVTSGFFLLGLAVRNSSK